MKTLKIQVLLSLALFFISCCGGTAIFVGMPTMLQSKFAAGPLGGIWLILSAGAIAGTIAGTVWFIITQRRVNKLNGIHQRDRIEEIRIEKIRIALEEQKEEQRNLLEKERIAQIKKLENYGKHSKCPQCGAKNITLTDNVVCAYCGSSYHF